MTFDELPIKKQLKNALKDNGFTQPTPIQEQSFSVIRSGKDLLGIAQTGTGKTLAYLLPLLEDIPFQKIPTPRVLIIVPTRELVVQVTEQVKWLTEYMSIKTIGIYGGVNINTQKIELLDGCDVLVSTPRRLYDLVLANAISLRTVKKVVIDEVDVMLDLGFRVQLQHLFDLLPEKRQSVMFSATMTDDVEAIIDQHFIAPEKISIAVSGTPLENINQYSFRVKNFYTKVNLLKHLIEDKEEFSKVIVFASSRRHADLIFDLMEEDFSPEACVIHSNKSQNARLQAMEEFDNGEKRILITTDVMARGIDLSSVTQVINIDTPQFPENYMHRIGRTGRAKKKGSSYLFYTEKEAEWKQAIEDLMQLKIESLSFPTGVEKASQMLPEEKESDDLVVKHHARNDKSTGPKGESTHQKKAKNLKTNQGSSLKKKKDNKLKRKKYKRRKK